MTGTDNAAVNTSGAANSMGVCYSFVFCFFPTNLLAWDGFADGAAGASRLWLFAGAVTFNYAYKRETVLDVLPAGRGLLQLPMLLAGQSGCQHKWAAPETQLGSARLGSARLGRPAGGGNRPALMERRGDRGQLLWSAGPELAVNPASRFLKPPALQKRAWVHVFTS